MPAVDRYTPRGTRAPTPQEKEILNVALGKRECDDSLLTLALSRFLLAVVAALLFVLLSSEAADSRLRRLIPDDGFRLWAKAGVFFVVVYVLDSAMSSWRQKKTFCVN